MRAPLSSPSLLILSTLASLALLSIAHYYLTTLSVWFGHWLSHQKGSPTRGFHLLGHHAIYPSSRSARAVSPTYRGGEGRTNSLYSLAPCLALQLVVEALVLPRWWFALCFVEMAALLLAINYVHEQFHVAASRMDRFGWFVRARAVHDHHHDVPRNFMVADHVWDRLFRTFKPQE